MCYRLVARQKNMDNTRWNRGHTRRVNNRRCSVDLTWLAISQAGVNDFICRQYLVRSPVVALNTLANGGPALRQPQSAALWPFG